MNADGSGQTNLTRNPAHDFAPAWSPDGQTDRLRAPARTTTVRRLPRVRWSDDLRGTRHERRRQRAAKADAKRRQVHEGAIGARPRWSPDGRKIAFVSGRDGNAEIYVMNADGSGQRNLTRNARGHDTVFAWSPAQR